MSKLNLKVLVPMYFEDKYEKAIRQKPKEPLYEVDVTFDCYGVVERNKRIMSKSEFEQAKKQGYFLA